MLNDITDEDIAELSDADLRELIGKLCEATLNKHGIDTICVTYGGNQDEPDGGVDVRVRATDEFNDNWAVPRNNTIFQVKKPAMPDNLIKKEMLKKDGKIKDSIVELARLKGAYIIACSGQSLSDLRKNKRIEYMKSLLSSVDHAQNIKVDFYDSKRIATWVKQFPALTIWVNDKLCKRTMGWKNYENWSNPTEQEKEFIIDEDIFLHKDNFSKENERTIVDGINEIRELLSKERKVVRLAGLSGVGKTRFAQALFDNNIGNTALSKEKVIYCDIGSDPNPVPIAFVQELLALQENVILIIDNCDKELHNKLAEFVCSTSSKLSLLTIEYDVKEDVNVESYNYYLDTSSENTIRKMLKRDFSYIKDYNIETIVKCSDGNFRIARYLAKTIDRNENVGMLQSEELFKRLFFQNNQESQKLLDIGRVCSIFISFNVEYKRDDYNNELNIVGRIIGENPIELIKGINELNKRQIIQKRGNMRAVLPYAISNKLADEFLGLIPKEIIIEEIKYSKRLQLSFFRRLKFLHDKEYTMDISDLYLDKINFQNLDENEMEILNCIKVISPEKILCKMEQIKDGKFYTRDNDRFYDWARILTYIAYDPNLFYRAAVLLIEIAVSEKKNENYNSVRDILYKLFHLMLSGTHATINERLKVVDLLLNDSNEIKNKIALKLIDELLETSGFIGQIIVENTSRSRDYGYYPKTNKESKDWYLSVLEYCKQLINNNIFREEIKEIISNNFRNLASIGLYYELEDMVKEVLINETWPQIWISVGVIKYFDKEKVPKEMLVRMNKLQEECFPITIEDKIKVFLNKGRHVYWQLEDTTDNEDRIGKLIKDLGKEIGSDKDHLEKNLLNVDDNCGLYRISDFVDGLYEKCGNDKSIIFLILNNINDHNEEIYLGIISHYLALMNETGHADMVLDEIFEKPKYNRFYPRIQFGYQLKKTDIKRVKKSLLKGCFQIEDYSRIEFVLQNASIRDIIEILKLFPKDKKSENIIISILHHLYCNKRKCDKLDEYARSFIAELNYAARNSLNDYLNYEIGKVVENCFDGKNDKNDALLVFDNIIDLLKNNWVSYYEYNYVLGLLIQFYPTEFLNKIFLEENIEEYKLSHFFKGYGNHQNIINSIDEKLLIQWIEDNKKAKEISGVIDPIEKINGIYVWRNISIYLFENYIEDDAVVKNLISGIHPTSWEDKYSSVLETRLSLAKELMEYKDKKINGVGILLEEELKKEIYLRQKEEEKMQDRYNTFE